MRRVLAACLLFAACRSAQPGSPIAPLRAATAEEARQQLDARAAAFAGERSIMRVRVVTPEQTQSFRAQLVVPDRTHMELVVYTPIGTTAAVVRAEGDRVQFEKGATESAEDLARRFGFYAADLLPAEMGMVLLGLPPRADLQFAMTPNGIAGATIGDVTVAFDPPVYPPKRAVITRGSNRIEIEHQEIVATK